MTIVQRLMRLAAAVALTLGIAAAGVGATAAPAAAANTYVWDDVRGSVAIYRAPNHNYSTYFNVPNGERVVMKCWLDNAGHRWFYVQTWNHGYGYVWAAWTYNQVPTPHC